MISFACSRGLVLLLCAYAALAQDTLFPTANPNDPTPAPCIGDPDSCVCIVGGEKLSVGESYRQLKDPRVSLQSLFSVNAVDMLFIVDESSSMIDEHYWLRSMVGELDEAMRTIGIGNHSATPNRYGLVGFGSWKGRGNYLPTLYPMSSRRLLGSVAEFLRAAEGLSTNGVVEDGYKAIEHALQRYDEEIRSREAARLVVLITDEDLDNRSGISYQSVLKQLTDTSSSVQGLSYKLNVLVNHRFRSGDIEALGVTSSRLAYIDSTRSISNYVIAFNGEAVPDGGHGNTLENYVRLAWATGGAAWNMKKLFDGGFPVHSFTRSFIDVKVHEALTQLLQCVECVCSAEVNKGLSAVCNVSHVERVDQCVNDTGMVYCDYKGQVYSEGDEFRDFDILREGQTEQELCVDVVFVVDESGSMVTEHRWLEGLTLMIDQTFKQNDIGSDPQFPNRFGLVGFASNIKGASRGRVYSFRDNQWINVKVAVPNGIDPLTDLNPEGDENDTSYWGSSTQFSRVISRGLFVDGQIEDGYSGIATALKYYHVRSECAHHIVLVTDEDRDRLVRLNRKDLLTVLTSRKYILTVAIDLSFLAGEGDEETQVLGCDRLDQGYMEVKSGIFPYRVRQNCRVKPGSGGRTTQADYYDLAISTGGAGWDLKKLREGGLAARAFTAAFIEVSIKETVRSLKVCKLCQCTEDGTVSCEDKRKGDLEIDCLIPPEEIVTDPPPTATPNVTTAPLYGQCTNPYNTSQVFDHGSSLEAPPEVQICVKRLVCDDGRVEIEIQNTCEPVNCSSPPVFPPPPNCCPVCQESPTDDSDKIDINDLQSTGPNRRSVTVTPNEITVARGQNLIVYCKLRRFNSKRISVEWYKEDTLIVPSEEPRVDIVSDTTFTIRDFKNEDSGTYACVVREGERTYGATVTVKSEDEASIDQMCFQFDGITSYIDVNSSAFSSKMPGFSSMYNDVHLEFNSTKPNGVLYAAYSDGCREFILVSICNKNLSLVWNLGGGRGQLSVPYIALHESHTLQLSRIGSSLTLSFNGNTRTSTSATSHSTLDVKELHLGGHDSACARALKTVGCRMQTWFFAGSIKNIQSSFNRGLDINDYPSYNVGHCPKSG